ncbi:MAG: patatin-like phospholipase family protein [Anaerolineae bacterium]
MSKQVAIACQGGGLNAAFTVGVLKRILAEQEPQFELAGLSGTSAGALCAFITWYGLQTGGSAEASRKLEALWADFAADTPAEKFFNRWIVGTFRLQGRGLVPEVKFSPYSPYFVLLEKQLEFAELMGLREEFVNYESLLKKYAPALSQLEQTTAKPRLLIGAVNVLSGGFKAFDSRKGEISYAAVRASGAIPWWGTRAVWIGYDAYWDGVFSQNPPVKNFITGANSVAEKPDEIWVIRINPQTRLDEPDAPEEIEDRRNELAGNLSLNQEIDFIETVNKWLALLEAEPEGAVSRSQLLTKLQQQYKPIAVKEISMSPDLSGELDLASKLDRSPAFIKRLMADGEKQAEAFLQG